MADRIQHIASVQTGTAELHVQHVEGSAWHPLLWIFFGRERVEVPVNVFVLAHCDGVVLVDAGMTPRVASDPEYWPDLITRAIMNRIFRFHIDAGDGLGVQLALAGFPPASVNKAIITHLHFDHVGGIADIPGAELIVTREAWDHMLGPHPEREGVLRRDIEMPDANWRQIDLEPLAEGSLDPFTRGHNLMGDGSIVLLPTPGHLAGLLSVFVKVDPPILFVSDLCYRVDLMTDEQFPGTGDHKLLADSWARVRALKQRMPNLVIVPAHDPDAAAQLSSHPLAGPSRGRLTTQPP